MKLLTKQESQNQSSMATTLPESGQKKKTIGQIPLNNKKEACNEI